jgi:predicted alpha-1,6-mannanase (GH76 family)
MLSIPVRLACRAFAYLLRARAVPAGLLIAALITSAFGYRHDVAASRTHQGRAATAAAALQARYGAGTYQGAQFWQSANALQATIDYMRATGSRAYLADLDATYRAHHGSDRFLDYYYDDEGWWALTWISAYRLTRQTRYLEQARDIFADMTGGWDDTCRGGIWWSKARRYKNAIANELFLAVAARLGTLTSDSRYTAWAQREWAWFRSSGMLTPGHLVVDGLAACKPILTSPTWTYNQGMLISALTALSSQDPAALRIASSVADAVIGSRTLSPDGILREPCEAARSCAPDQRIFKGIFVRGLQHLYDRVRDPRYSAYLRANASSLWDNDRRGSEFGPHWAGPFGTADTAELVAALSLLNTQAGGA